jgi:hypothetical protein
MARPGIRVVKTALLGAVVTALLCIGLPAPAFAATPLPDFGRVAELSRHDRHSGGVVFENRPVTTLDPAPGLRVDFVQVHDSLGPFVLFVARTDGSAYAGWVQANIADLVHPSSFGSVWRIETDGSATLVAGHRTISAPASSDDTGKVVCAFIIGGLAGLLCYSIGGGPVGAALCGGGTGSLTSDGASCGAVGVMTEWSTGNQIETIYQAGGSPYYLTTDVVSTPFNDCLPDDATTTCYYQDASGRHVNHHEFAIEFVYPEGAHNRVFVTTDQDWMSYDGPLHVSDVAPGNYDYRAYGEYTSESTNYNAGIGFVSAGYAERLCQFR